MNDCRTNENDQGKSADERTNLVCVELKFIAVDPNLTDGVPKETPAPGCHLPLWWVEHSHCSTPGSR
jgi:hypothetical protein